MEVTEFEFKYAHLDKEFEASCSVFQVPGWKFPTYRVAVPRPKGNTDIYIFYYTKEKSNPFFWFEHPTLKNGIAKSIAKALEKKAVKS